MPTPQKLNQHFPRYERFEPRAPIWCVTPNQGRAFHRFFDTNPISPTGRYLAFLRLPQEQHTPAPGEVAEVCVTDLNTGEERTVATTRGWENQMGANINWGPDDTQLIFNDVDPDTWDAFAVRCEVATGDTHRLQGPVYHVSPDGFWACGANPIPMRRTQGGYGVVVPDELVPRYAGPRDDEGLWLTHTQTGETQLVLSLKDAIEKARPPFEIDDPDRYEIYGFHSKFNPQGDRLIFSVRFFENTGEPQWDKIGNGLLFTVLTLRPDGTEVCNAVPTHRWKKRGNHINWFPDGNRLSMNLVLDENEGMRFVRCNYDGSDLRRILPDRPGSGHPTVHPDGMHIFTDTYVWESGWNDGTTPLRWVDLQDDSEEIIARIPSDTGAGPSPLRVDPHPAWDHTYRWITFNAFPDDTRRIFVMDMQALIGS